MGRSASRADVGSHVDRRALQAVRVFAQVVLDERQKLPTGKYWRQSRAIVHNRALGNRRRNGLYIGEHQLVGLHAEPELPAQHLQAEAALA